MLMFFISIPKLDIKVFKIKIQPFCVKFNVATSEQMCYIHNNKFFLQKITEPESDMSDNKTNTDRYKAALERFINSVKNDITVLAVIVWGSLAYDQVWEKSDVDIVVLVRDQKIETSEYCIDVNGIIFNVHIQILQKFMRSMERSKFDTAFARAKVAYTTDETITEFLTENQKMGADDIRRSFFSMACDLIGSMEKIEKWIKVKKNLPYAQHTLIKTSGQLAFMELVRRGIKANREAVVELLELDPDFIAPFYLRPMQGEMTEAELYIALDKMHDYLVTHLDFLIETAKEAMVEGEMRTATMLSRFYGISTHGIYHIFDFLTEQGIVIKVTNPIRITPKGRQVAEEVSFMMPPQSQGFDYNF